MSAEKRRCYLMRTGVADRYQAHLELDSAEDLLDVDLSPLTEGRSIPEAVDRNEPLFLVCTHGRHDQCCSIRGNQVSRIACAQQDVDAWECSHIGGDRFAANLVCFPHGLYYGRVGSHQVIELMRGYAGGSLSLEHFRGRCCHTFPVQAAEYFLRRETSLTEIDALVLKGSAETPEGVRAQFVTSDPHAQPSEVEVRITRTGEHRLTCRAKGLDPIPFYELVSLTHG